MHFLLSYDIAHPRRLQKLHKYLLGKGIPIQYSIFYLQLSQEELDDIESNVKTIIHRYEDDVRIYPIYEFDIAMWEKPGMTAVDKALFVL